MPHWLISQASLCNPTSRNYLVGPSMPPLTLTHVFWVLCPCCCGDWRGRTQSAELANLTMSGVKAKLAALPTLTPASAEKGSKQAAARKWACTKLFSAGLRGSSQGMREARHARFNRVPNPNV